MKKRNNKMSWKEYFNGFKVFLIILIFSLYFYDYLVEYNVHRDYSTNTRVMKTFFLFLDIKFGKNGVLGFILACTVFFGLFALNGYLKEKNNIK